MTDYIFFIVLPYVSMILAIVVGLYRYFLDRFSYSSFSSQFFENKQLFWGSVPFHYGIVLILLAHLLAIVFPTFWSNLIGNQFRLYILEITGLALALFSIFGLVLLIIRRLIEPKVRYVSSTMDWLLLILLVIQMSIGFWIAFNYRWGSLWYLSSVVPWLLSLVKLNPKIDFIIPLPLIIKLHFILGFIIIGMFPFTRLIHIFTFPITYIWRPYQVYIWNRKQSLRAER